VLAPDPGPGDIRPPSRRGALIASRARPREGRELRTYVRRRTGGPGDPSDAVWSRVCDRFAKRVRGAVVRTPREAINACPCLEGKVAAGAPRMGGLTGHAIMA
jgi:hypothetical protein